MVELWCSVLRELRPDLAPPAVRTVVWGVFPVVNQVAYALDGPGDGVPLVRAWALGAGDPSVR